MVVGFAMALCLSARIRSAEHTHKHVGVNHEESPHNPRERQIVTGTYFHVGEGCRDIFAPSGIGIKNVFGRSFFGQILSQHHQHHFGRAL